jgi:hypothetical protein
MGRDYNNPQDYLAYFNENKTSRTHFHTFVMRYDDWKNNPETEWLADHMEKELNSVPDEQRIARFSSEDRLRQPLIRFWNVMDDQIFEVTDQSDVENITGIECHALMRLRDQEGLLYQPNMENVFTLLPRFPNLKHIGLSCRVTYDREVMGFFTWLGRLEKREPYESMQVIVSLLRDHWLSPFWTAHYQRLIKRWGDSLPSREGLTLLVVQGNNEFGWHDGKFVEAVQLVPGSSWEFVNPV